MESELHGIGRMARECGLTVSALRFYDGAGVLAPAWVDPQSGYRWYRPEQVGDARLVARLRRVGLPLPEICRVLAHQHDRATVDAVLDAHLQRLEHGLADARRELSAARDHIASQERAVTPSPTTPSTSTTPAPTALTPTTSAPTTLALGSDDLLAALSSVRFAVSSNPELPMLGGVLLDVTADELRVVATDRYRMAVATAPLTLLEGPVARVLAPAGLVDDVMTAVAPWSGPVTVVVDGPRITVTSSDGTTHAGELLDLEFPDWERVVRISGSRRVRIDTARLRSDLAAAATRTMHREQDGVDYEVSLLTYGPDGGLGVAAEVEPTEDGVAVDREFLLQALDAGNTAELLLELDGPIGPLAIRDPDRPGTFSVLMPTRLT